MRKNLPSTFTFSADVVKILRLVTVFIAIFFIGTDGRSQARLIKDVVTVPEVWTNEYSHMTDANGTFYFIGGATLYRSDGSVSGTKPIKKFRSVHSMIWIGTRLYITADDGINGVELWKSNGTSTGTVLIKDIYAGPAGSNPEKLTNVNGTLYFVANNGTNGRELWKSNGTFSGTVMVKDILLKGGSSNPDWLTNVNGTLFFTANDGQNGYELWKSNGNSAKTVMVKDIRSGSKVSSAPEQLASAGGALYFVANDGASGKELWKSDGTQQGTFLLKDILPGSASSGIENMTKLDNTLYFTANDGVHGHELWKSTGSAESTILVKDMTPGKPGSHGEAYFTEHMSNFTNINGTLYFTAYYYQTLYIWKSDGTEAGTVFLHEAIGPGIGPSRPHFTYMNGYIYFFNGGGYDSFYFYRMKEDGSDLSALLTLMNVDFYSPIEPGIVKVGDFIYISGRLDYQEGFTLIKSDGSQTGTKEFMDVLVTNTGSNPRTMASFNGKVYFHSSIDEYPYDEYVSSALYRTDGTEAGTEHLFDTREVMFVKDDKTLFIATRDWSDLDLYKVDISGNLSHIKRIGDWSWISRMVIVNGMLYFHTTNNELWRSNGTAAGTFKLTSGQEIVSFTPMDNKLLYQVQTPDGGEQLWKSGVTVSSTLLVKTIRTGPGMYASAYPTAVYRNRLFFVANGTNGNEIWVSNGTTQGTYEAIGFNSGDPMDWQAEYDIAALEVYRDTLFVSALHSRTGNLQDSKWYLWSFSNGGSQQDILGEVGPVREIIPSENGIYLEAISESGLAEIWHYKKNDQLIRLTPQDAALYPSYLDYEIVNDVLYFSYFNWSQTPLWRTDGTSCGTYTINLGTSGAWPLERLDNELVFSSYAPLYGLEPHAYNVSQDDMSPCDTKIEALAQSQGFVLEEDSELLSSYPNPFKAGFNLRIKGEQAQRVKVSVYSAGGMPVEMYDNWETNTDYKLGDRWKPGLYLVHVNMGLQRFVTKVIKE